MDAMYRLPADEIVTDELEIKRSRFITFITRVTDETSARGFIDAVKADYPDARHHCSAYIYRVDGANPVERSSDDGEPSGTAGNPMLEVLRGSGMLDIAAVVVRYFGGIKLGTGGLVRAYSDAVDGCLGKVTVTRKDEKDLFTLTVSHTEAGRLEADLRGRGITVTGVDYTSRATITVAVDKAAGDELSSTVAALTKGTTVPRAAGSMWVEY
ncbi:YigZ family protein [Corynebacterium sp. CCM 8862]|uniref:YigZ family protein n=2 Tax=Corynebacterium mendelii TaxID=2765362 RepID=A0A939E159_9CORY|nr:YigZ family protein [Corynebacterium mendelii]MBN9643632.1 YigZ family protein [Corynebacterium mendelii]